MGAAGGFGAGGGAGLLVASDIMALVELAARQQAHQQAGEEVLDLGEPSSFKKEAFSSLKTASVFLATRRLPGLAVRQRQLAANGENGSSLGEDIFIRSGGSVTFQINGTLTLPNPIEGGGFLSEVTGPGVTYVGHGDCQSEWSEYLSGRYSHPIGNPESEWICHAEICISNRAAHYQAMPQLMVPSIIAERSRQAIPLAKFSLPISTYTLRASITSKSTLQAIAMKSLRLDSLRLAVALSLPLMTSTSQLHLPTPSSARTLALQGNFLR